ncbi:MAG: RNA polymerase sigma-70 factor [Ignavibacteriales bacterium]|nr:RNA polymerase sigma-70 factor [Ignavibacteriales bacterium]
MLPDKKIFDLSDRGLFELAKNNDQIAFNEIYKRYWSKLYIYAYNVLREKDICEDIIQEMFTNLWTRRKSLQIDNVSAYLYQAVRFQIFKQFRQRKLLERHNSEFEDFISENRIEESMEYLELYNRIESLIESLPEQRKIIFRLSRNEELSNKEIASKLNLSVQTIKNQITNALKTIRKSLKSINIIFL